MQRKLALVTGDGDEKAAKVRLGNTEGSLSIV